MYRTIQLYHCQLKYWETFSPKSRLLKKLLRISNKGTWQPCSEQTANTFGGAAPVRSRKPVFPANQQFGYRESHASISGTVILYDINVSEFSLTKFRFVARNVLHSLLKHRISYNIFSHSRNFFSFHKIYFHVI